MEDILDYIGLPDLLSESVFCRLHLPFNLLQTLDDQKGKHKPKVKCTSPDPGISLVVDRVFLLLVEYFSRLERYPLAWQDCKCCQYRHKAGQGHQYVAYLFLNSEDYYERCCQEGQQYLSLKNPQPGQTHSAVKLQVPEQEPFLPHVFWAVLSVVQAPILGKWVVAKWHYPVNGNGN